DQAAHKNTAASPGSDSEAGGDAHVDHAGLAGLTESAWLESPQYDAPTPVIRLWVGSYTHSALAMSLPRDCSSAIRSWSPASKSPAPPAPTVRTPTPTAAATATTTITRTAIAMTASMSVNPRLALRRPRVLTRWYPVSRPRTSGAYGSAARSRKTV